jgi:YrbI family 3-deoxy-D-manno-octulosonate 8-phosphate phosphatase
MNVIAIIPARGGSKGIPGKNLETVGGLPLITRTIRAAKDASCISSIIVSTDDAVIASTARAENVQVVDRPTELATDTSTSEDVILHTLATLNDTPDLVVFLQCTSPFTTGEDIQAAVDQLIKSDADSCFTAAPYHRFIWESGEEGAVGVNHKPGIRLRRQDLKPQWEENGAAYVFKAKEFTKKKNRFFGKITISPMTSRLEIDTQEDLRTARLLYRNATKPLEDIQLLVMDFDGVLSDNRVYTGETGQEMVSCSKADSAGLAMLREAGMPIVVITAEQNPCVVARCEKLGVSCIQNSDKIQAIKAVCETRNVTPEHVCYLGNDLLDLPCMEYAGVSACVSDSVDAVKAEADILLTNCGGHGAVRELCDMIMEKSNG